MTSPCFALWIQKGNLEKIKENINVINVNSTNEFGYTPLTYACICEKEYTFEIIKLLLKNGGDVNGKVISGYTPIMFACRYTQNKILNLLIENGADVNQKNNYGETALMLAVEQPYNLNNMKILKTLLENGANINAKDNSGRTALMFLTDNFLNKISLFLKYGADLFDKDTKGTYTTSYLFFYIKNVDCKTFLYQKIWENINKNIEKLSLQFSRQTVLYKEIWKFILYRHKFNQLKNCNRCLLIEFGKSLGMKDCGKLDISDLRDFIDKQISCTEKYMNKK